MLLKAVPETSVLAPTDVYVAWVAKVGRRRKVGCRPTVASVRNAITWDTEILRQFGLEVAGVGMKLVERKDSCLLRREEEGLIVVCFIVINRLL